MSMIIYTYIDNIFPIMGLIEETRKRRDKKRE
jgi:hypothetical protein